MLEDNLLEAVKDLGKLTIIFPSFFHHLLLQSQQHTSGFVVVIFQNVKSE